MASIRELTEVLRDRYVHKDSTGRALQIAIENANEIRREYETDGRRVDLAKLALARALNTDGGE